MKKLFSSLLLSFLLVLGVGCTPEAEQPAKDNSESQTEEQQEIGILVETPDETLKDVSITFEEDTSVLDILQENLDVETADGFITSMEGVAADNAKQEFWAFYVNGEMAQKGAAEIIPEDDDEISFKLETWE